MPRRLEYNLNVNYIFFFSSLKRPKTDGTKFRDKTNKLLIEKKKNYANRIEEIYILHETKWIVKTVFGILNLLWR